MKFLRSVSIKMCVMECVLKTSAHPVVHVLIHLICILILPVKQHALREVVTTLEMLRSVLIATLLTVDTIAQKKMGMMGCVGNTQEDGLVDASDTWWR